MWSKFFKLLKKDEGRQKLPSTREIMEEIDIIKKNFRKQAVFLDLFRKEILERLEEKRMKDVDRFVELAEAFFHYDRSLREVPGISSSQHEALGLVWRKLEDLLSSVGIEIIRKMDVDFDPRLYEAVEKVAEGNGKPVVRKILQPGYICKGRVMKPAKVIVERENLGSQE